MSAAAPEVLGTSLATIDEAKVDVESASAALEELLSQLQSAPRAEKTAVSSAVETALARLRDARVKLANAETLLAREVGR